MGLHSAVLRGNSGDTKHQEEDPIRVNKHLLVLLVRLFAVSIGFGITLLVLAFYAERLAMAAGTSYKRAHPIR